MHNSTTNTQSFLAIQYLVGGQLFVKLVGGYARTSFSTPRSDHEATTTTVSVRLRLCTCSR